MIGLVDAAGDELCVRGIVRRQHISTASLALSTMVLKYCSSTVVFVMQTRFWFLQTLLPMRHEKPMS